jgi:hypothetical protein
MKYYNKINRNFNYRARLYFNKRSNNRSRDDTPRFWVELESLNFTQRVGYTDEGGRSGYAKNTSRFHTKLEDKLSDDEIENLSEEVKKTAPFGYDQSSASSLDKYLDSVKYNPAYQSFYKKYWHKHKGEIKQSDPYPYIEVNSINEVINTKHITQEPILPPPDDEEERYFDSFQFSDQNYECAPEKINVLFSGEYGNGGVFRINNNAQEPLFLGRNKEYVFTLSEPWEDNLKLDGHLHPFRFSRRSDGVHEGVSSYFSGVNIEGSAHAPGSVGEKVTLTTDANTPSPLYYYSPLDPDVGGIITFPQPCDADITIPFEPKAPSPDWHFSPRYNWVEGYHLVLAHGNSDIGINSSGIPDHGTGNADRGWITFPNSDVPHEISGNSYDWEIPRDPTPASSPQPVPVGPIGMALNGIPFFSAIGEPLPEGKTSLDSTHIHTYSNVDADGNGWTDWAVNPDSPEVKHRHQVISWVVQDGQSECYPNCEEEHGAAGVGAHMHNLQYKNKTTSLFFDACEGRPNSSGLYHYYKDPECTYVDISGEHSPIVGYAFDGYPIYGPREENGIILTSTTLDEHHGHDDPIRGWHYHVTPDFPYVLSTGYKGVPNESNFNTAHDSEI